MKIWKRVIAFLMIMAMLIGFAQPMAHAQETGTLDSEQEVTGAQNNSLGVMLSEDIQQEQSEMESGGYAGYNVVSLTIEDGFAVVEYDAAEAATLVVAIYSEDGTQLLATNYGEVFPEESTAYVELVGQIPAYFVASAYLLDQETNAPLCSAYETIMYTQDMQELLDSTVDDYDEGLVLNLDNDDTTNFAVYTEDVIRVEAQEGVNEVVGVDHEALVYVIENADSYFTSLQAGDIVAYPYEEDALLIIKVGSIRVDGTTVTITGTELELEDVFSHVKIEAEAGSQELTVDDSTASEGITYEGYEVSGDSSAYAKRASADDIIYQYTHKFKVDKEWEPTDGLKVKIEGSLGIDIKVDFDYYVSWRKKQVEFITDLELTANMSVSAAMETDMNFGDLSLTLFKIVSIGFKPSLKAEISAQMEFSIKYNTTCGFSYKDGKLTDLSKAPEFSRELSVEGTLKLSFDLCPKVDALWKLIEIELQLPVAVTITAKMTGTFFDSSESRHLCKSCMKADIKVSFEVKVVLKILFGIVKVSANIAKYEAPVGSLYYSFTMDEFGFGQCPYQGYKATFVIRDYNGDPLPGATVTVTNESGEVTELKADETGTVSEYLAPGLLSIEARSGDLYYSGVFRLNKNVRQFLTLRYCGNLEEGLYWSLSGGQLTFTGSGRMKDFASFAETPWYVCRDMITSVYFASGITYIGSNAFNGCGTLDNVRFAYTIESVGENAFQDCTALTKAITGNLGWWMRIDFANPQANPLYYTGVLYEGGRKVTSLSAAGDVGTYAFYNCDSLISVNLRNYGTTIGDYAFYGCDQLATVTVPQGMTEIGEYAFYGCPAMKKVTIPASLTNIGSEAFGGCTGLTGVYIKDLAAWCGIRFADPASNPLYYAGRIYLNNRLLTSLSIPGQVTSIGNYAFYGNTVSKEVSFPEGLTQIGVQAFAGNTALTEIYFSGNAPAIAENAFRGITATAYYPDDDASWTTEILQDYGGDISWTNFIAGGTCGTKTRWDLTYRGKLIISGTGTMTSYNDATSYPWYSWRDSITSIVICSGVTGIGNYAFSGYSDVTEITIGERVSSMGMYAFSQCTALEEIRYNANEVVVYNINYYFFENAGTAGNGITVTVGGNVKKIPSRLFYHSGANVTEVIFEQDSLCTSIGWGAFSNCTGLTSVTLGSSLTVIDDYAFYGCTGLTAVHISDLGAWCQIYFSSKLENPLYYAKNLYLNGVLVTDAVIPSGVTGIGEYAFYNCINLTGIEIPNSVTSIGAAAFAGCTALTGIEIPNSVTSIGGSAFSGCTALTGIEIPDSVTSIGEYVFYGCTGLTTVKLSEGLTSIGSLAFQDCVALTSIVIPDSVTSIGVQAFTDCTGLTSAVIGDGVLYIDTLVFSGCTGLTSVEIGSSVTSIGYQAFYLCSKLTSVVIPEGVTTIEDHAFGGCAGLTEITIPGSVTSIGSSAFGEPGLKRVYYTSDVASWCAIRYGNDYAHPMIYATELYFNGEMLSGELVIPEGVTSIPKYAFQNCDRITRVVIPESVTSIGGAAFANCTALTGIEIPNSVTSIGDAAFAYCTALTGIEIPNSVTSIGGAAFSGCTSLASVKLSEKLSSVEGYTFDECVSLTEISIPDSVTKIGGCAFYGCSALEQVTIGKNVSEISTYGFYKCESLTTVTIPASVTLIDFNAFASCSELEEVVFQGDAPDIDTYAFASALVTVYYPAGNTTWTEDVWQNCYGIRSAVAYELETAQTASVQEDTNSSTESEIAVQAAKLPYLLKAIKRFSAASLTDTANATEQSFTTEAVVTEQGKYTAAFTGLVPGVSYTFLVVADTAPELLLEPGNLLYIRQGTADANGTVQFTYRLQEQPEESVAMVCGPIQQELKDAVVTFPKMAEDGSLHSVVPTVMYNGVTLTEGVDYSLSGDLEYTEAGTYTCQITGMGDYTGTVECPYTVDAKPAENVVWTLSEDGTLVLSGEGVIFDRTDGGSEWYGNTQVTTLIVDGDIWSIGAYVFQNCTSLTKIIFEGDAVQIADTAFAGVTATVSYPGDNASWTADLMQDYGGNLTWTAFTESGGQTGDEGVSWSLSDYGKLTISGIGAMPSYSSYTQIPWYSSRSDIVSVEIENGVTNVGGFAFYGCSALLSVELGDSVTAIEKYAFRSCKALRYVEMGENVTEIQRYAFYDCKALETVELPDSVATIGVYGFYNCASLMAVEIPESVTAVEEYAFYGCSGLKTLEISEGVTTIAEYAFYGCTGLELLELPDSMVTIEQYAFNNCTGLTDITVGSGVTRIGNSAFDNCTRLTAVYISDMGAWCRISFFDYYANPLYLAGNLYLNGKLVTHAVIPDDVTSIGSYAFYDYAKLTGVTIGSGVASIGYNAFYNCSALEQIQFNAVSMYDVHQSSRVFNSAGSGSSGIAVTIGANVERIPGYLFCSDKLFGAPVNISSVVFEEGSVCTTVGSYAFSDCTDLTDIELPDSVTSIGSYAFCDCTGLTQLTIGSGVTSIGSNGFSNCTGLRSIAFNASAVSNLSTTNAVFTNAGQAGSGIAVTVGANVERIPAYLFRPSSSYANAPNIISLVFEENSQCTSIGNGAFYYGIRQKQLTIPDSVQTIGDNAFQYCDSLTQLTLGSGVTQIGEYAFGYGNRLNQIIFTGSAPVIGDMAFYNATATASYPAQDASWTADVRQDYGGSITWEACSGWVALCQGDSQALYGSVQSALAACDSDSQYLKLLENVNADIVLTRDLYIDLNGYTMTGTVNTNGYGIYGMDSATNAYSCENMGYFRCADGNGNAILPQKHFKTESEMTGNTRRYMAIETENGWTFHRFYLSITHMSLKPAAVGVGYKAVFCGDEMVIAQLDAEQAYGYTLQLEGGKALTVYKRAESFTSGRTVSLRVENYDVESYGETPLQASVCLKLADGTVIESTQRAMTLRQLTEAINTNYADYTVAQLAALAAMIQRFPIMQTWEVGNIYKQEA